MKKVLFVIETLRGGGAERALSNICTHFPEEWQIDILVNDDSLIEYPYRGNILTLSRPKKKSVLYFIGNIVRRILYLRRLKRRNGYKACISFLDSANLSNVLSGNRYCKTIVSVRNNIIPDKVDWIEKTGSLLLTRILYVHADQIVTVSKEIEMDLVHRLKIPDKKVLTITNGYDYKLIGKEMMLSPLREKNVYEFGRNKKIVVTIGRNVEQKGHWHLIRAFSYVTEKESGAVLYIVGDGPLAGYLAELIRVYDLEENVVLVGHSDNPFWYLSIADIFVLPSLYEGYPNVLAEAICCGVPCIAADVHSGTREILAPSLDVVGERINTITEEEYGVLIPVCSGKKYKEKEQLEEEEQNMADAILMLLDDDRKRKYYEEKSKERRKDLDINKVIRKWIDAIENVNC